MTNTPVPPTPTSTNTPVPPTATMTDTPVPPTATPTPTPTVTPTPPVIGTVDVIKSVNPDNGTSPTSVEYRIQVVNNTNVLITLTQIIDDMSAIGEFLGSSCSNPDGSTCTVPTDQQWIWNGSIDLAPGSSATMIINGNFAALSPPPPPPAQQFCNTADATYTGPAGSATVTSNSACFTLN
jgi:hypothetical protein